MFAKFAVNQHLILMKWSLEKKIQLYLTDFFCVTIFCADTAREWSFQASWQGNMTNLRWVADHNLKFETVHVKPGAPIFGVPFSEQ